MVRINKVTTKTGDRGMTVLAGGQQVPKTSIRIEAYGNVDELNAILGLIAELMKNEKQLTNLLNRILRIQNELFNLGSQLSVLQESRRENTPVIGEEDIGRLEKEIEEMNSNLQPLQSFVLPGGCEISAHLHIARTVCRRTERSIVKLMQEETIDGTELPYINRLSDWFFVASRYVCNMLDKGEILWQPGERR